MRSVSLNSDQPFKNYELGLPTDHGPRLKIVAELCSPRYTIIKEVMIHKVVTCHMDDDLHKAMDTMAKNQFRRISVVDSSRFVEIVAQADVAARLDQPVKNS